MLKIKCDLLPAAKKTVALINSWSVNPVENRMTIFFLLSKKRRDYKMRIKSYHFLQLK